MASIDRSAGLTCPSCSGVVPVPEGARVVRCPFCDQHAFVQGERGVRRWQVACTLEREQALTSCRNFFKGLNRARSLPKEAKIRETFLVYLPYWRVHAWVAGWILGRVKSGDDDTKPVEVEVLEEMDWNDAATDVSEFGVHRIMVNKEQFLPYDVEQLRAEGMVFEPAESPSDALQEAETHFAFRARTTRSLKRRFFEKIHVLRPQLSLVYYPLWVTRYEYRQRNYQVVVDGVYGELLYGKAPGNIFYRAAALVGGMALGNLVLVNGSILALLLLGSGGDDDGSLLLLALPFLVGLALVWAGYRAFRYGEEVEEQAETSRKAAGTGDDERLEVLEMGLRLIDQEDSDALQVIRREIVKRGQRR